MKKENEHAFKIINGNSTEQRNKHPASLQEAGDRFWHYLPSALKAKANTAKKLKTKVFLTSGNDD